MHNVRTPHRFTLSQHMQLDIPGRTELLGGLIYDVSPKNPPHSLAVSRIAKALNRGLSDDYRVNLQDPVAVKGWTGKYGPEVDIAVVAENHTTRCQPLPIRMPLPRSPTARIRTISKYIPLYVAANVPTWHVNIPARRVEVYATGFIPTHPPTRVFVEGESFDILGVPIRASDLFAP